MRCCEGTLQTTACLLILIIYDLPLKKNNNNYIWSQVILILFLFFFVSSPHFFIYMYSSPGHKAITHTSTITGARPIQSTAFFKNKIYIYIYLLQDEAILQLASFMAQLTYTGSPILCVVLTSISH